MTPDRWDRLPLTPREKVSVLLERRQTINPNPPRDAPEEKGGWETWHHSRAGNWRDRTLEKIVEPGLGAPYPELLPVASHSPGDSGWQDGPYLLQQLQKGADLWGSLGTWDRWLGQSTVVSTIAQCSSDGNRGVLTAGTGQGTAETQHRLHADSHH